MRELYHIILIDAIQCNVISSAQEVVVDRGTNRGGNRGDNNNAYKHYNLWYNFGKMKEWWQ